MIARGRGGQDAGGAGQRWGKWEWKEALLGAIDTRCSL